MTRYQILSNFVYRATELLNVRIVHWWTTVFWFKSQEQIRGGSKKFLGGSLLEAMLGLVDGAIVPPIPTPCTQTVGGGRAGYHLSIFGQDFRNF